MILKKRKDREFIPASEVREKLDYWIGSLDDDWVVKNIKEELGL